MMLPSSILFLATGNVSRSSPTGTTNSRVQSTSPSDQGRSFTDERPLLKEFARGIRKRIQQSEEGMNHFGKVGAYTSDEIIPCLEMQCEGYDFDAVRAAAVSSRSSIRRAFTESESDASSVEHGRSSGSGSAIIRLVGTDAESINGLVSYADRFFDQVDRDGGKSVKDAGVFRVANHVYAGFDENVNDEGKMQFLDTRMMPNENVGVDSLLLPLEVGDLVGQRSLNQAHRGMTTLLDIGSQITSAVSGMDAKPAKKLIDNGTHQSDSGQIASESVSNSYHRLIRYMKPPEPNDAAFQPHIDSSFLTLIPMPKRSGLEVWCPSKEERSEAQGEWVRPAIPTSCCDEAEGESAYVIAMAGEFLELISDGKAPVCIHRVIAPKPVASADYSPRVSAPLFLRPRRGKEALLDINRDIGNNENIQSTATAVAGEECDVENEGLYHQRGLLDECDGMHLWSVHGMVS